VTGANRAGRHFGEKDSHAVDFLHQQGVTRLDVVNLHLRTASPRRGSKEAKGRRRGEAEQETAGEEQQSAERVETYTLNLNCQAAGRQIDPLIGREREISGHTDVVRGARTTPCSWRGGRRQDRDRRRPGAAHRRGPGARRSSRACQVYALDMGALLAGNQVPG